MDDRVFPYESCVFCYGLDLTVQAAPKRACFHRNHLCSEKGAPVFRGSFRILAKTFLSATGLERRCINHKAVAHLRGHNFVVGLGDGITVDDFNHGTHAVLGAEL